MPRVFDPTRCSTIKSRKYKSANVRQGPASIGGVVDQKQKHVAIAGVKRVVSLVTSTTGLVVMVDQSIHRPPSCVAVPLPEISHGWRSS